jgi:hypothetical protein
MAEFHAMDEQWECFEEVDFERSTAQFQGGEFPPKGTGKQDHIFHETANHQPRAWKCLFNFSAMFNSATRVASRMIMRRLPGAAATESSLTMCHPKSDTLYCHFADS